MSVCLVAGLGLGCRHVPGCRRVIGCRRVLGRGRVLGFGRVRVLRMV